MKKIIAALALSVTASASHAVSPEAVIGALIGGVIIGQATQPAPYYVAPPVYVPPPVYSHPRHYNYQPSFSYNYEYSYNPRPQRRCFSTPLYDAYGRYVRSMQNCTYGY